MRLSYATVVAVFAGALMSVGTSCKGPTGPQGVQGDQGPQGNPGPQGPQGNANVQVDTVTLTNSQWAWNSTYWFETAPNSSTGYFTRYHDVADTSITSAVLTQGMVLVYFIPSPMESTVQWQPLPYQFVESSTYSYNLAFETMPDTVRLHFFFTPGGAGPTLSTYTIATYQFKIVAITGTIADAMRAARIDLRDYQAVRAFIDRSKRVGLRA